MREPRRLLRAEEEPEDAAAYLMLRAKPSSTTKDKPRMKSISSIIDRVVSIVLTVVLVVFVAAFVQRQQAPAPQRQQERPALSYEQRWRDLLDVGIQRETNDSAGRQSSENVPSIEIVEFVDFECPFCRQFDEVLRAVEAKFEGKVRRTFIHTPIPSHRFAYHTARMSECARNQGKFWPMHDALFARQDSFGLRQWSTYAKEAGIQNLSQFEKCSSEAGTVAAVEGGLRIGREFQVSQTPTVYINGWRLAVAPTTGGEEILSSLIEQFLAGKTELELVGSKFSRAVEVP